MKYLPLIFAALPVFVLAACSPAGTPQPTSTYVPAATPTPTPAAPGTVLWTFPT